MIGETINNRYRVDAVLGHGGMGAVYKGHDLQLERDVAIKLLNQVVINNSERERLFHEAKLIARLRHQNIVSVFDVGDYDGSPFFIMEYVDGGSLREHHPGDLDGILKIITQITRALQSAHDKGIIHRDLKPENVLLEKDGTVKIVDFGIARSDITRLTSQGRISGTAHYMAPEILKGEKIDGRTDLYSLGVILYELTTGQLPFDADSLMGLIQKTLFENVIPPIEINPDLPQELNELILRLLSKDPDSRPSTAGKVLQALETSTGIPSQFADEITTRKPTRIQSPKHNLISQPSTFIGREDDLIQIGEILAESRCRLLTLVGIGGIGKTRLATQAAFNELGKYPDGVWMVELASLTEPGLLPQEIASVFGVSAQEAGEGKQETDVLVEYLKDKQLLLVLDNCEHLIEACAHFIEQLLSSCPRLTVLATTREDLRIPGETIFQVDPMVLPGEKNSFELFQEAEAVQLFIARAVAARHQFELTQENRPAVQQICSQLDGIPLAIELAAARINIFTPQQIAEHLTDRFQLLTSGSRTALPRHKTLEAAMDWSYELLSGEEQVLLCQLSVFQGGFTLQAIEQVIDFQRKSGSPIYELIAQLVDKSLVIADEREEINRYRMLETVRQYSIRKLHETESLHVAYLNHAQYYLQLAEAADLGLRDERQIDCLAVLDAEHENLRVALRWSLDQDNADMTFRLISSLGWYWFMRGYWNESGAWLLESLDKDHDPDLPYRAKAIFRAGGLELIRGKLVGKVELVEEALRICRKHNNQEDTAWCLNLLGQAASWRKADIKQGEAYLAESIEIFTKLGDAWGTAWSTRYLGQVMELSGNYEQSIALQKDALDSFEKIGDYWNSAHSLYLLGGSYFVSGERDKARLAYEQCLEKCARVEDKVMAAHSVNGLAQLAIEQGELDIAEQLSHEALEALQKIGDDNCAGRAERNLGEIFRMRGDFQQAHAQLMKSLNRLCRLGNIGPICLVMEQFAALYEAAGRTKTAILLLAFDEQEVGELLKVSPKFDIEHERLVGTIREQLDEDTFNQLWNQGLQLALESAIQLVKKTRLTALEQGTG